MIKVFDQKEMCEHMYEYNKKYNKRYKLINAYEKGYKDGKKIANKIKNETDNREKIKESKHKAPMHLILWKPIRWLIRIRLYGMEKYPDPFNYKQVECMEWYDACLRHLAKWQDGEDIDQESGLSHLAHALCNLVYLIDIYEDEPKF